MAKKDSKPAAGSFIELGVSGLKRSGGLVREEFHKDLQGRKGMKIYREMRDNSAVVGACLGAIEMLIRQVPWHVEPFSQENEDLERAEFVDTCRRDLSSTWEDTISDMISMLEYGWSLHEIVYKVRNGDVNDPTGRSKYSDGRIGWKKLPIRAQDTLLDWDFDENGGTKAMRQQGPPDYKVRTIPIEKALLFRAKPAKNNPEGRSILRNAYLSWYFAKRIAITEGIGIERDLTGFPVAWIPAACMLADATDEQKATRAHFEAMVRDVKRDEQEGAVFPLEYDQQGHKIYDFTLLTSGGKRQFDTTAIIARYQYEIVMTMLQDVMLMGQPGTISYKGKNMPQLFAISLTGWLGSMAAVFNDHGIPRLMRMNGWPTDRCPQLKHGAIEAEELGALGDYISKVFAAGFVWNQDEGVDDHLRRVARLPKRAKGVKLYGPDGKPVSSKLPAPPAKPAPAEEDAAA